MFEFKLETLENYFYNIIASIVILIVGFAVGILAKRLVYKILKEIELNQVMKKIGIIYDIESILSYITMYLIYLITIIISLNQIGITSIVLYLVLSGVLMLLVLTFLVGLKDVIPNFIGCLYLHKNVNVREGRKIDIKEISGVVERIGYLETEIRTDNGDLLYVPNSLFIKSKYRIRS